MRSGTRSAMLFSAEVFLPWRVLTVRMQWDLMCDRHDYPQTSVFGFLPITYAAGGHPAFRSADRGETTLRGGVRATYRYVLSGAFADDRAYRVVGAWNYSVTYSFGGRSLSVCRQRADLAGAG